MQKTTETCIFIAINLKGQSILIPRTFGGQIRIKCVLVMCARLHIICFASLPYLKFLRNKAIKHSFLAFQFFNFLPLVNPMTFHLSVYLTIWSRAYNQHTPSPYIYYCLAVFSSNGIFCKTDLYFSRLQSFSVLILHCKFSKLDQA